MRRLLMPLALIATVLTVPAVSNAAPSDTGQARMSEQAKAVIDFWTPERRAAAIPRDIVVNSNGDSFVRTERGFVFNGKLSSQSSKAAPSKVTSVIKLADWTNTSAAVAKSAGRLYFVMGGSGYVCSATLIDDGSTSDGFSTLITAAHCIEDETSKEAFATNVMFVPSQQQTTSGRTDLDCSNDPYGCWVPTSAYVDKNWVTNSWFNNAEYDFGFYRIPNTGSHAGRGGDANLVLETTVPTFTVTYTGSIAGSPIAGSYDGAFGFPAKSDPKFQYCAETVGTINAGKNYWLPSCGLTGGASGGPWLYDGISGTTVSGAGSIFSVNSWGYNGQPGMAGPLLARAEAVLTASTSCVSGRAGSGTVRCTSSIVKPVGLR